MKTPIFTDDPYVQDSTALQESIAVSSQEWAHSRKNLTLNEALAKNRFQDRAHFIRFLETQVPLPKNLAIWLKDYLKPRNIIGILSLGAGECHVEYHLKKIYPSLTIVATDFDDFIVRTVSRLLTELDAIEVMDIKRCDLSRHRDRLNSILMVDVFYALTDIEGRQLFKCAHEASIDNLIITSSVFWKTSQMLKTKSTFFVYSLLRKLKLTKKLQGRFHGWARTIGKIKYMAKDYYQIEAFHQLKEQTGQNVISLKRI